MVTSPKVVLITGCSKGGIGFSLCEEFASQGCKVYATARKLESMEGFAHENIEQLKLDVTSDEDVHEVISTVIEREGRIDVVINNAGAACMGPLIDISMDDIRRTYETNTFSIIRMAKAIIPYMAARKSGTIVNIGSVVGETPTPWSGVYASTKSAVHTLTEVLYMECLPFNISVVLVCPGAVKSNFSANHISWFSLPSNSIYSAYIDSILRRINISQGSHSLPSETFAQKVATAALAKNPPRYMMLGGSIGLFRILKWLPRGWVLRFMWKYIAGN